MFAAIVSQQNPRVKNAARLRESRVRRREGLFLIDGVREAARAWERGFEFVEVFWNAGKNVVADEKVDVDAALSAVRARAGKNERDADAVEKRFDDLRTLLKTVDAAGVPTIPLATGAFEKIGFGERDEAVVAVVRAKTTTLDALDSLTSAKSEITGEAPLIAVIEGVEKPGNVGAILRSADGAGLDALIVAAPDFDLFNPNAIRSSLGAISASRLSSRRRRTSSLGCVAAKFNGRPRFATIRFLIRNSITAVRPRSFSGAKRTV